MTLPVDARSCTLEALRRLGRWASETEVVKRSGHPRSRVRPILEALAAEGLATKRGGGKGSPLGWHIGQVETQVPDTLDEAIVEGLRRSGPTLTAQLAGRHKVDAGTIKRRLDALAELGRVLGEPERAGPGRPQWRWRAR